MLKVKWIMKMIGLVILGIIAFLIIDGILFLNFYPSIGGSPSSEKIALFKKSENYDDGVFVNQNNVKLDMSFGLMYAVLKERLKGVSNQVPENPLPVLPLDSMQIVSKNDSIVRVTWFGHSSVLLEISGKNILIDPVFSDYSGPHPWLGPSRFPYELPIEIEKLPQIDAVLYSHDHYDHLDYKTLLKLKDKVRKFYVPLGVGSHLKAWGVDSDIFRELNWWDEIAFDDLQFICTPAQHFSGRGLLNRNSTLWASWVIKSDDHTIYFSGDSGYGSHFKEIGEKYGPFDIAMLECGQYNKLWQSVHMLPEQTAQAAMDLKTKKMMPIHWGAFVLALHSWKDPVERVTKKAQELGVNVITPQIREQIALDETISAENNWWVNWN